jgi:hypothetical protein
MYIIMNLTTNNTTFLNSYYNKECFSAHNLFIGFHVPIVVAIDSSLVWDIKLHCPVKSAHVSEELNA